MLIDWEPRLVSPMVFTRLADITVGKKKFQRSLPGELYRAICEVKDCDWTGNWISVWHDWKTLIDEVEEEYIQHMLVKHGSYNSSTSNK